MPERVLVIEPEPRLREDICLHISLEGLACEGVEDGRAALALANADRFDAVIVDNAPSIGGIPFCERLRGQLGDRRSSILLLTPPSREADALSALERCVDDYMSIPFGMRELVARVRALLRRSRLTEAREPHLAQPPIVRGSLVIDPARRRVRAGDVDLTLTEQEFQLLRVLADRAGCVFSRDALLACVWGNKTFVTLRSVDALVKRVRRRLHGTAGSPCLVTVRRVGYKFQEGADDVQKEEVCGGPTVAGGNVQEVA
jgi:DNA-binding response OmpR family regulator